MLDPFDDTVRFIALSVMLMVALYQDAVHRRIPNTLVLAGTLTGAGLALAPSGIGVISSFAGGMVGLLVFGLFYVSRFLGAGDVKLISAVGFFTGFPTILKVSLCILMAGGVLAFAWGIWTSQLMPALVNLRTAWFLRTRKNPSLTPPRPLFTPTLARVPYALAIAAGTWLQVATPWSPL